jgi:hypothetical protein
LKLGVREMLGQRAKRVFRVEGEDCAVEVEQRVWKH